jgi:hypothetical protein
VTRHQHGAAAREALEADVRSNAVDLPIRASTCVRLAQQDDIAWLNV